MDTPAKPLAIIICDDLAMRAVVRYLLEESGCEVIEGAGLDDLPSTIQMAAVVLLVVIAAQQSGGDGTATLATLRRAGWRVPTILCARGMTSVVRQRAFALGAQDVVGLPVVFKELQARLHVLLTQRADLHRGGASQGCAGADPIHAGGLTLYPRSRTVGGDAGWSVRLSKREMILLATLMSAPGRVFGRHDLLDRVWGEGYDGDGNTLNMCVGRLRAKLSHPVMPHSYIRTLRGQGYVFDARHKPRPDAIRTTRPRAGGERLDRGNLPTKGSSTGLAAG